MRRILAALALVALLAGAPAPARAVDWALLKDRPIAALVALPALICTMPFMAADWVITKIREAGDDDDESEDY